MTDVVRSLGGSYLHDFDRSDNTEEIKQKYEVIAEVNDYLFSKIPFEVIFTEDDHYKNAKEMFEKVSDSGKLYIFTGGGDDAPALSLEQNLKSRAVHDVFGHMASGGSFTFAGELNAYYEQRRHYPEEVWDVLFAEIPMQTAAYYYNNSFDFEQRAIEATQEEMDSVEHLRKDYSERAILSGDNLLES